jgi:hypothetical protein
MENDCDGKAVGLEWGRVFQSPLTYSPLTESRSGTAG